MRYALAFPYTRLVAYREFYSFPEINPFTDAGGTARSATGRSALLSDHGGPVVLLRLADRALDSR